MVLSAALRVASRCGKCRRSPSNNAKESGPMHPFESAGLGKAPFRFAGCESRIGPITLADSITQIGSPGQPMGTCD